jgi:hypothetical protein
VVVLNEAPPDSERLTVVGHMPPLLIEKVVETA